MASSRWKRSKKSGIGFHFGVRNFDGDGAAVSQVGGAENRGHAAAGNQTFDAVMIELLAGMEWLIGGVRLTERQAHSTKLVRAPAVHAHAFDALERESVGR